MFVSVNGILFFVKGKFEFLSGRISSAMERDRSRSKISERIFIYRSNISSGCKFKFKGLRELQLCLVTSLSSFTTCKDVINFL